MANKKKTRKKGIMGRSDIPFAQRLQMERHSNIVGNRNHSAQVIMFCTSIALHEIEGIGYKRLTNYSVYYKSIVDEFYEDIEVGMAHAKRRMEQMGMPISGEFYKAEIEGLTKRQQEIHNHSMEASQIAQICNAIAMNDFFGFGKDRQFRISERVTELTDRYAKEGDAFLLEEMEKIGFAIKDGTVTAYMDEDNKAVLPSRARKEGWAK